MKPTKQTMESQDGSLFSIPYAFETIVYELPVGGYSAVIKSASGFTFLKQMNDRPLAPSK
jgi:hypothetical protein